MGSMTRAELMEQGALMAGDDNLDSSLVRVWLDAWLARTAKSWPWPALKYRVADVPLPAGVSVIGIGSGEDGTTPLHIHRLLGGYVLYRTADSRTRSRMLVRQLLEGDPDRDADLNPAVNRSGMPTTCMVRVGNGSDLVDGCLRIYPDPVQTQTIYLSLDVHIVPPLIGSSSANDSFKPWYPNDRTLIQAVKCAYMEVSDGGEGAQNFNQELDKLGHMVVDDRDFDGEGPGDNQAMELDKGWFL